MSCAPRSCGTRTSASWTLLRRPGCAGNALATEPARRVRRLGAGASRARFAPRITWLEDRTLLSLEPTSTALAVSAASAVYGQPVTLTATVSSVPPGNDTP